MTSWVSYLFLSCDELFYYMLSKIFSHLKFYYTEYLFSFSDSWLLVPLTQLFICFILQSTCYSFKTTINITNNKTIKCSSDCFLSLECDPIETYCQKKPHKTWLKVANSHFSMCLCHHLETYLGSICFQV